MTRKLPVGCVRPAFVVPGGDAQSRGVVPGLVPRGGPGGKAPRGMVPSDKVQGYGPGYDSREGYGEKALHPIWTDRHLWKHYLSAISFTGGKNQVAVS